MDRDEEYNTYQKSLAEADKLEEEMVQRQEEIYTDIFSKLEQSVSDLKQNNQGLTNHNCFDILMKIILDDLSLITPYELYAYEMRQGLKRMIKAEKGIIEKLKLLQYEKDIPFVITGELQDRAEKKIEELQERLKQYPEGYVT